MRGALAWGVASIVPAAGAAWTFRGSSGAASVAIGIGMILLNTILAAAFSAISGAFSSVGPALIALPSFAVRLGLLAAALLQLKGRPYIDEASFVLAFCGALTLVLVLEARAWRRTPWLFLNYGQKERA